MSKGMIDDSPPKDIKAIAKYAKFDYQFTFIIVGESGVGKSCIVCSFAEGKVKKNIQPTVVGELSSRILDIKNLSIKVQIWDTAGQENFRSMTRSYYRNTSAAIVAYDITSRSSFDKITQWIQEVKENSNAQVLIYIVGNKLDLAKQRQVTYEEGYQLAKSIKCRFTETCAFDLSTIEPMFKSLAEDVLAKIENGDINPKNEHYGVKLGSKQSIHGTNQGDHTQLTAPVDNPNKKKGCCLFN